MSDSQGQAATSEILWTEDARERIERAPAFLRGMVKRLAEKKARELGYPEITGEILDQFKSQMMGRMGGGGGHGRRGRSDGAGQAAVDRGRPTTAGPGA